MYCFKLLNILGLVQLRPRVFNTQKQYIEQRAPLFNVLFFGIEHSGPCSTEAQNVQCFKTIHWTKSPFVQCIVLGIEHSGPCSTEAQNVQYLKAVHWTKGPFVQCIVFRYWTFWALFNWGPECTIPYSNTLNNGALCSMYCFKLLNILGLVQLRPRVFNT